MIRLPSIKSDPDCLPKLINIVVLAVALVLIWLAFFGPWFSLPHYDRSSGVLYTEDSKITLWFKIVALLVGFFTLARAYLVRTTSGRWTSTVMKGAVTSLIWVLFFPTVLVQRDGGLIGDAAWLQQQHDTMTWLGGDVYRAHSERSTELGTGVNAQDPPDRLAVYRPPVDSLGVTQINDWLWWLGYGPSFTQFVGSAWFYAVMGYFLVLLCVCGYSWRVSVLEARNLYKQGVLYSAKVCVVLFGSAVLMVHLSHHRLVGAKAAMADGQYSLAQSKLDSACDFLPSLRCDTSVIRQLGYIELKLGNADSANAQLYMAHQLESQGHYGQARAVVESLSFQALHIPRYQSREVSRQQLRMAINCINSGRYSRAIEYLDRVLTLENNCFQACFHRQLVALQIDDLAMNRNMHKVLLELSDGFRRKNIRGVKAASAWMLAQGELGAGHVPEALDARKRSMGK